MSDYKKMSIGLTWVLQIMSATILFRAAYMKFAAMPHVTTLFSSIGMEPFGRILIGMLEMISAVMLLIPNSHVYGAFLASGIMAGAIIGHFTDIGMEGLYMAGIVFVECLLIIYIRRNESSIFKNMFDRD